MNEALQQQEPQGNGVLPYVTNRYLFWYEDEGKTPAVVNWP